MDNKSKETWDGEKQTVSERRHSVSHLPGAWRQSRKHRFFTLRHWDGRIFRQSVMFSFAQPVNRSDKEKLSLTLQHGKRCGIYLLANEFEPFSASLREYNLAKSNPVTCCSHTTASQCTLAISTSNTIHFLVCSLHTTQLQWTALWVAVVTSLTFISLPCVSWESPRISQITGLLMTICLESTNHQSSKISGF